MTAEEIIQRIQAAYDFAESVMPNFPLWIKFSGGNFIATIDISEIPWSDDAAKRLSKYGFDDVLFSSAELQASGLTLQDLRNYSFGTIPVEVS